jgi:surface antigen
MRLKFAMYWDRYFENESTSGGNAMILRKSLALCTAFLMAATAVSSASAQPRFQRNDRAYRDGYDDGYREGYRAGYEEGRANKRFDERYGPPPPPPRIGNDDRDARWRQRYARTYTYNDDNFYQECRQSVDPAGVIAGALIGGLLGNAVGRGGGRGGATIAGVVVGGALGATLTRNLDCEDRSYAYKTYYDGFNAGRSNASYQWRNPKSGHNGEFRVGDYYNDPDGFRCANYTQQIFINGRPQAASGHACQQPDGTWAIVN